MHMSTKVGRVIASAVPLLIFGFISPAIAKKPVDPPVTPEPPSCNAAQPDYVRYVASLHQAWVTEPDAEGLDALAAEAVALAGSLEAAADSVLQLRVQ